jgi:ComF family protein
MLKGLFEGLLDLLAPARCAACNSLLNGIGAPFCPACSPLLEWLEPDAVGLPYRALFRYGGPAADAIRRLKYEGSSEIASALGPALTEAVLDWQTKLDAVTAIPLSPRKLRVRGYNQSGLLARQVARGLGLPFQPRWLTRVREGQRQVGQTRHARLAQARGAFAASPQVSGRAVLLLDDVRTTGATLDEAGRVLEQAGASAVYRLVLAEADERGAYTPL